MTDINFSPKLKDHHFVDPQDPTEVDYLHRKYPWIEKAVIKAVIVKQGPERKNIEAYLERYHN